MSVDRRRRHAQSVLDTLRSLPKGAYLDATQIKETSVLPFWRDINSLLHDLFMGGYINHFWEKGVFPRRQVFWITELGRRGL